MLYTDSTLKPVHDGTNYISQNGTQYPHNYPKDEIEGLFLVEETPRPDGDDVVVTGFSISKDHVQVWETRNKTDEELAREADVKRQFALTEKWPDAFTLIDDLINDLKDAGFAALPTIVERDAIKLENPKGVVEVKIG